MLNKLKSIKPIWIKFSVSAIVLLVVLVYSVLTIRNTVEAYNIVSGNYGMFNYPNTIKVHSCEIEFHNDKELDIKATMIARISAENAYGQRKYNVYVGSSSFEGADEGLTSLDWYKENMDYMVDFYTERAQENNVFIPLLNFLIRLDW